MRRRFYAQLILASTALIALGSCDRAAPLTPVNQALTVSQHGLLSVTDQQATNIFNAGNVALQTDEDLAPGTADSACDVALLRSGPIGHFADVSIPVDLTSLDELTRALREPAYVKIIRSIQYCDQAGPYLGCAANGRPMMVVTTNTGFDGLVWAHEYGHTKTLRHRGSARQLMRDTGASNHTHVDGAECARFKAPNPALNAGSGELITSHGASLVKSIDVDQAVRTVIIDRVPIDLYQSLGPGSVPQLTAILKDRARAREWPGAMIALGLNGDEQTVQPILDLLGDDATFAVLPLHTRTSGLYALGYFLSHGQSPKVQALLERYAAQSQKIGATDARATSRAASWALALSGKPTALSSLKSRMPIDASFARELEQANEAVRQRGLAAYYGGAQRR